MAIASMITGILGLMFGCFGPIPGVAAVILGYIALQQIKKSPATTGGKPMAIIGIVTGSLAIFFYGLLFLWFILAGVLGNL
jgi:predicted acyltransferase